MNNIVEVNETSFQTEVLQASGAVVVDFYAPWCGPCKMLTPLLEQFAGEYQGQIKFTKVNVDHAQALAATHNVSGVPTLACFRDGKLADTKVGMAPPKQLRAWLEQAALGKRPSAIVSPW